MYRLQTKFSIVLFLAIAIFSLSTVIFPKQEMFSGTYHFHLIVLIFIEIGVSLIAAFVLFDRGSLIHKYKVCLTMIGLSCFYGFIGNVFAYNWKINPGMDLQFSTVQLVLINLGGILTALTLYKLEPIDAFSDGGLDRLQRAKTESGPESLGGAEELAAKGVLDKALDENPKASVNKLRGIGESETKKEPENKIETPKVTPEEPAKAEAEPEPEKKAPYTSPPQVEIDLEASDEMLSGPLNPNPQSSSTNLQAQEASPSARTEPGSTGNRIQAARRRNTSTFTKLQALSASGTGSVTAPQPTDTEGSGDLKSLLDRLDTDEEEAAAPSKAETKTPEAPVKEEPQKEPESVKPEAEATPAVKKEPYGSPIEIRAEYLFDDLDKSKTPTAAKVEAPKAEPKPEPKPDPKPKPEPVAEKVEEPAPGSPKLESLLDRAEANQEVEDKSVAESPKEEEKAPEEVLEDSTSNLLSQRFAELTDDDSVEEKVAEKEAPVPEQASVKEEEKSVGADSGDKVFGESVDSEIDDIFTTLAPEEAQKEVAEPAPTAKEPEKEEKSEPEKPKEEESPKAASEEGLFDQDVGSEIDDIFTTLAPEEAQRTVNKGADSAPAKEEVKEEKPKEDGDSDKIFKLGDDDVDDIFAGLTTEEQKDVDQSSLDKVKGSVSDEKKEPPKSDPSKITRQTGEMPALDPDQAKKIREKATTPGKFSETLSKIPSLKNTVEGLLQSLEDDQPDTGTEEDLEDESLEVEKVENLTEEQLAAREANKKLKDFGRLSGKVVSKATSEQESQGTMKTIGKLLIDKQAVEKIIQSGESKELGKGLSNARIISAARGKGISDLLTKIDEYEGVAGSIVVGHDGLVMASTLRDGWDKDMMGALSTALLSTSNLTTKKLEIGKLRQMVMLTQDNGQAKTTVLTDVDVGILAVFLEETDVAKIDGLLVTIQETIHG